MEQRNGTPTEADSVRDDGKAAPISRRRLLQAGGIGLASAVAVTTFGRGSAGTSPDRLEIVAGGSDPLEYSFTATGTIGLAESKGFPSAEADEATISENDDGTVTATGIVEQGYADAFDVTDDVVGLLPKTGEYRLYLNGERLSRSELITEQTRREADTTTEASTDSLALGGGAGYDRILTSADADYVVQSASGLTDALSAASSGDIVFVAGNAVIDTGGRSMTVPAGVTLASNRGEGGAPGALLYTEETPQIMLRPQANARVTGLRLRGRSPGETVTWQDGISFDTPTYAMQVEGGDVEVDNCKLWGWPDRAVYVTTRGAHIHRNYILDNNGQGLGYGVSAGAECLIEYNYFHNNRHSVTCAYDAPGYTARYNHFSSVSVMQICDIHDVVEGDTTIESNIVENGETRTWDANDAAGIAGYAKGFDGGSLSVAGNWFFDQASAYDDSFAAVSDSGNVYGGEGSHDPADVIPNHPGLSDRPWT